jgi:hypothetical protein
MEDIIRLSSDELTEVGFFDGSLFYRVDKEKGEAEVVHAHNNHIDNELVVPNVLSIDGTCYIITSIGKKAFIQCDRLTSVVISDNILTIGKEAFSGCNHITNIKFGKNLKIIESNAFSYCNHLSSLVIPEGVTKIGANAFASCDLYTIHLPNSIVEIGDYAFSANPNLSEINFPKGIKRIGGGVVDPFSNVFNDSGDIVYINDSVLGYREGLSNSAEVLMREGTTYICSEAFQFNKELTSVYIPNSVTDSGCNIFTGCENLQYAFNENVFFYLNTNYNGEFRIPEGIKIISGGAFRNCKNLTSLYLPDSIIEIGEEAFYGCIGLTSIIIPSNVKCVRKDAFAMCDNLIDIKSCKTTVIEDGDIVHPGFYFSPEEYLVSDNLLYKIDSKNHTFDLIDCIRNQTCYNEKEEIEDSHTLFIISKLSNITGKYTLRRIEKESLKYLDEYYNAVKIPDSVEEIGDDAFADLPNLTKVTIGNGVRTIGKRAFAGSNISSIVIPQNVCDIGEDAFADCHNLKYVIFLSTNITKLEKGLFMGSGVTHVNIPDGVRHICQFAFEGCKGLHDLYIPDSVICIESNAFQGCVNLQKIRFPKKPINIGRLLFGGFKGTGVTSITIPGCLKRVDNYAFSGCSKLKSITIREGVEEIGSHAFESCTSLTRIIIPGTVKRIEDYAFSSCSKLRYVILNDGVQKIGVFAFRRCTNLTKIIVPDSVIVMDECFEGCDKLQEVYNKRIYAYFNKNVKGLYEIPHGITTIAKGAFSNNNNVNSFFSITIPGTVKEINNDSFKGCSMIKSVHVQDGVKSIGNWAFSWCSNLSLISLPKSLNNIGIYAFSNCTRLDKIILPDNVKEIREGCFLECCELTDVYLGKHLEIIGNDAFLGCSKLTGIDMPKSTTEIGCRAFAGCPISSITIPSKVKTVGKNAFKGCDLDHIVVSKRNQKYDSRQNCNAIIDKELGKLVLCSKNTIFPDSIHTIGEYAFSGCGGLSAITIPDTIVEIENSAFEGCYNLKSVYIPANTIKIGEKTFAYCNSLEGIVIDSKNPIYDSRDNCNAIVITDTDSIHIGCAKTIIPQSVFSIGKYAFYGCISLSSIVIPDNVRRIGESAFENCENIKSIVILQNVRDIEQKAFYSTGLITVTICSPQIDIGYLAFDCHDSLKRVYLHIIDPYLCKADYIFDSMYIDEDWWTVNAHKIDLFVPQGTSNLYKKLLPWRNMHSINEFDDNNH